MSLRKNTVVPLEIESLSSDGNGVGRVDGQAVFVPGCAVGDRIQARIVKDCGRYAFAIVDELLQAGPGRVEPDCPVCGPCGGCCFRHLDYAAECRAKEGFVQDAFTRIGGFDLTVEPILPAPSPLRYRNKVQLPVGTGPDGHLTTGFYAGRSHRIVPCSDCLLQPEWMDQAAQKACRLLEQAGASAYDETTGKGLVRHLFLRQGWHSGQRLLCFVINGDALPREKDIAAALAEEFSLTTILVNRNTANTNVILGRSTRTLLGPGRIEDTLAGVPIRMGIHEFYQVNTPAAEQLYAVARQYAALRPEDRLLDVYCGMGTIGLSMYADCARLTGIEVVPQSVDSAREVAARMGADRAEFFCMDAGQAAEKLARQEGYKPDVIVLDPPRKGCDAATLDAVVQMSPRTLVMVSCNPATAARDARTLAEKGYQPRRVQPVDLFPRTKHVETVVLLSKLNTKQHIEVELNLDELDLTAAESKATYEEIREYVLEHTGLKVSHLYIAQVKQKYGIIERENYNKPKSENSRQPKCPPEKEAAITEALKHFGMI